MYSQAWLSSRAIFGGFLSPLPSVPLWFLLYHPPRFFEPRMGRDMEKNGGWFTSHYYVPSRTPKFKPIQHYENIFAKVEEIRF